MMSRLNGADRAAGLAALVGLLAAYLPWYAYSAASTRITVNGFRASVFGDLFFIGVALTAVLVLIRLGVASNPLEHQLSERAVHAIAAAMAGAGVLLQLLLTATSGKSISFGLLLAVVAAAGLAAAAWMRHPEAEPRRTVREMLAEDLPD
jgi:hypothetical protein